MKKDTMKQLLHDSFVTAGLLALTTGLTFLLFHHISDNLTNIALFYIVAAFLLPLSVFSVSTVFSLIPILI